MMQRAFNCAMFAAVAYLAATHALADESDEDVVRWLYGIDGGFGAFTFRKSLYVDREPDGPGNLGENWAEFFIKPWLEYEQQTGRITWFGRAGFAYVRTGKDAAEVGGGEGESAEFDDLYLGLRSGAVDTGQFEVAAGRLAYELGNGFIVSDGYADGGSRGGYWSNPRTAWVPGGRATWQNTNHKLEGFYLARDERPESNAETEIAGLNYEWLSGDSRWNLGASYMQLTANALRADLDGADVFNLRGFIRPFSVPLNVEAEFVREDNGKALDAIAWYVMADYSWVGATWQPIVQYRYAYFEGDNPDTPANEDYNPLFPGFTDWGTWWQGEIAGEYFLSNSNLKSHMIRLHLSPSETVGAGILLFDYRLDQPGSYQGGVSSSDLGKEFNFYLDWQAHEFVSMTFVVARHRLGPAAEEAFNRTEPLKYAMIYLAVSLQ